jgi:DNA-binding transcriptional LysR family regulator
MAIDQDYLLFATVVDLGSLSAAGRSLQISPAMVSKRLARLEQRLGVRLVHRTTRRLALTSAGDEFHRDVLAILEAVKRAEDRVTGAANTPSGPLRVSAPTSFGRLHIAPRLRNFVEQFPRIELALDLSDGFVDLIADRIDIAIRITGEMPANVEAQRLATSQRVLAASPSYVAQYGAPQEISDLSRHRLLAADGQWPWRLVSRRQSRVIEGRSHVATNSSETVREMAIAGIGIALRSMWDVSDELRDGRLIRLLPDWGGPPDLGVYAIHVRVPQPSAAIHAFVDFLKRAFDPAPWDEAL